MQPEWIIEMLDQLEPDLREDFEERAAIMEYDGNLPRDHAECLALLNILRKHPAALLPSYMKDNTTKGECP
jgi:hypothetical protein